VQGGVRGLEHRVRVAAGEELAPQDRARRRHHQRGGDAVARDVGDDHRQPSRLVDVQVVVVAAHAGRPARRGRRRPRRGRRAAVAEAAELDARRDVELLLHALGVADCGEAALISHSRPQLARDRRQQPLLPRREAPRRACDDHDGAVDLATLLDGERHPEERPGLVRPHRDARRPLVPRMQEQHLAPGRQDPRHAAAAWHLQADLRARTVGGGDHERRGVARSERHPRGVGRHRLDRLLQGDGAELIEVDVRPEGPAQVEEQRHLLVLVHQLRGQRLELDLVGGGVRQDPRDDFGQHRATRRIDSRAVSTAMEIVPSSSVPTRTSALSIASCPMGVGTQLHDHPSVGVDQAKPRRPGIRDGLEEPEDELDVQPLRRRTRVRMTAHAA
jgi:hypothetical protein